MKARGFTEALLCFARVFRVPGCATSMGRPRFAQLCMLAPLFLYYYIPYMITM